MLFSHLLLGLAAAAHQAPAAAPPANDLTKVVCKSEDQTGSRLGSHRVCMTKAQWAERARRDKDDLDQMLRRQCNIGEGGACH